MWNDLDWLRKWPKLCTTEHETPSTLIIVFNAQICIQSTNGNFWRYHSKTQGEKRKQRRTSPSYLFIRILNEWSRTNPAFRMIDTAANRRFIPDAFSSSPGTATPDTPLIITDRTSCHCSRGDGFSNLSNINGRSLHSRRNGLRKGCNVRVRDRRVYTWRFLRDVTSYVCFFLGLKREDESETSEGKTPLYSVI